MVGTVLGKAHGGERAMDLSTLVFANLVALVLIVAVWTRITD